MKLSQEPQDKGERDSFYLKAPIKIQHIHSSPKLPIMVSTCWRDLGGMSEGIAEETVKGKVYMEGDEERGFRQNQ